MLILIITWLTYGLLSRALFETRSERSCRAAACAAVNDRSFLWVSAHCAYIYRHRVVTREYGLVLSQGLEAARACLESFHCTLSPVHFWLEQFPIPKVWFVLGEVA